MRKRAGLVIVGCLMLVCVGAVHAAEMNLVQVLTKNLGVTEDQASGGAGAIFKSASEKMSATDFSQITKALPEVTSLMKASPSTSSDSGGLGSVSSMLSKGGNSLSSLAALSDTFSSLGLSSEMVGKYLPIVLEYAQSKGGDKIAGLLKNALQ